MTVNTFVLKYADDPVSWHSRHFCCAVAAKQKRWNSVFEFMVEFVFESSVAERLWRSIPLYSSFLPCSFRRTVWCWYSCDGLDMRLKGAEVAAGLGELVASKQTFALLCTVQAAQIYLHHGRVVPKSSFECRLISWVDSDEGINIYRARSSKLYCTFIFLIQVTLKD